MEFVVVLNFTYNVQGEFLADPRNTLVFPMDMLLGAECKKCTLYSFDRDSIEPPPRIDDISNSTRNRRIRTNSVKSQPNYSNTRRDSNTARATDPQHPEYRLLSTSWVPNGAIQRKTPRPDQDLLVTARRIGAIQATRASYSTNNSQTCEK